MATTIVNPSPITAGTFGGFWVRSLQLISPVQGPCTLLAVLCPSDGTHLLATGTRQVYQRDIDATAASDSALAATLAALRAELLQVAAAPAGAVLELLQVSAPDPQQPVAAQILLRTSAGRLPITRVPDCYARAAQDAQFGTVLAETLAAVARLGGLSVTA